MNLNTCHMSDAELDHLDELLKENRKEEAKEYIISTKQDYLERIIQHHLNGYWFMRIKYSQKEERFLQTAKKHLEKLKEICPSPPTFVVWDDFEENINCGIFDSYSDFQEWSQADYIFRILDVL